MILLIYGILKKERKKRLMENRLDIARGSGQYFGAISKSAEWSLFVFQGKPFSITVMQVYAPTTNAEEAQVERF